MEGICARVAPGPAHAGSPSPHAWARCARVLRPLLRHVLPLLLAAVLALASGPSAGALNLARMLQASKAMGPRAERAGVDLRDLLARLGPLDESARLEQVNAYVNRRLSFAEDQQVWGQMDYWASPLESLARGQGDCEDYAIAKYFTLTASGIPAARLRLVYVRAVLPAQTGVPSTVLPHMVLAYYADNDVDPMILDNLVGHIRQASRRTDLTPVFSFNSEGLWNSTGPRSAGDPQVRLSRWRDLLAKAAAEGFE